mmetsp:Transcript_4082/g.6985  ORF Transcript_4082/g.6985 Transcript_4082/m.6985 type:complete len:221 (-) Transcript_4082:799-1461(-)
MALTTQANSSAAAWSASPADPFAASSRATASSCVSASAPRARGKVEAGAILASTRAALWRNSAVGPSSTSRASSREDGRSSSFLRLKRLNPPPFFFFSSLAGAGAGGASSAAAAGGGGGTRGKGCSAAAGGGGVASAGGSSAAGTGAGAGAGADGAEYSSFVGAAGGAGGAGDSFFVSFFSASGFEVFGVGFGAGVLPADFGAPVFDSFTNFFDLAAKNL